MLHFTFLISKKVIGISPRYLWWMSRNIISFFSENFTVEISTPVEYSTKNRFLHLWEKAQKWHLTSKNPIFRRIMCRFAQYLENQVKIPKDTLSNLQITYIGQIGRFMQNWKIAIFGSFSLIFYTEFQVGKIKSRKLAVFDPQTQSFTLQTIFKCFLMWKIVFGDQKTANLRLFIFSSWNSV